MWLRRIPSRDCRLVTESCCFKSGTATWMIFCCWYCLYFCLCWCLVGAGCAQARAVHSSPSRWYKKSGFLFDKCVWILGSFAVTMIACSITHSSLQWSLLVQNKCIKQIHVAVYWKCMLIKHCDTSNTIWGTMLLAHFGRSTLEEVISSVYQCSHASSWIRPWHLN